MTAPGGSSSRNVKIVISADVAQAIRQLGQVQEGLGGVSQQADGAGRSTRTMGDVMKGTLAAAGIQAGISGIVDGLKGVVSSGLSYERSMNTFGAVTQASSTQMQQMADTAKQLGADVKIPGASAQSAAAAMTELAKGGLTADQAMQAARGTMILAAAAQVDGAQAAEIQANALNTFGLKADQAGRVANVLANVANKSSGEITDFSQGLAQAGTVASGFGWSIEETATYLGLMANAGIKGSDAGTSLKTTMTALLNPTQQQAAALDQLGIVTQDANGKMISAKDLTAQLAAAKGRMSDAEFNAAAATAFGTDAVRTALVAAQAGTAGYDDMSTALGNVNGAQDVAAANSKGLSGVIDALKNTVDTASLSLFEKLQPSIMQVATAATGLVEPLADALSPALASVADLATGTLAPALSGLTGFLGAVAGPLSSMIDWFSGLPTPIGAAALAIGGVILLRGPLTSTFASWAATGGSVVATLLGTSGAAAAGSAGLAGWIASIRAASGAAATFGVVAKGALSVLGGPIGLAIIGATTALSFFSSTTDDASTSTSDFSAAIDENTGALNDNAPAVISKRLADEGQLSAAQNAGIAIDDYTRAVLEQGDALSKVQTQIKDTATAQLQSSGQWEKLIQQAQRAKMGTDEYLTSLLASGDASRGAGLGISDLVTVYSSVSGEADRLSTQQTQVNQANEAAAGVAESAAGAITKVGDAAGAAEEKSTPFGDALKEIRAAASEADANVQFLSITLLQMSGNTVPAEQQARANAAAFRAVGQATRDIGDANDSVAEKQRKFDELAAHLGTTLNGQAESATNAAVTQADLDAAGRDLADAQANVQDATDKQKDALDKAAQSARDMTAEAYNNGLQQLGMKGAIDAAVTTMQQQRDQFIKSATDAGIAQDAAEALADAQGLIPDNVRTTYETVGAEDARKKADELNAALDKINDRTVHYSVVGGEVTTVGTMKAGIGQMAVYADGGHVRGPGTGTSDSIFARVSNGEFVSTAATVARGGNRAALEFMHGGGTFPGFATGGLVSAKAIGDYKQKDWTDTLTGYLDQLNQVIKDSLGGFSGGLNSSQDPSSFGWKRASGIVPFSWNGNPFIGGVAGGTQSLWTGLMNALVPQIPGGLMAPIWAYENRQNVNSPGNASFHAYGLAADINAPQNPNGAPGDGRSGPGVIPAAVARSLAARFGMEWGGDFRGTPDPMHFEIHVAPSQIGVGGAILGGLASAASALSGGGSGVERWRGLGLDVLAQVGAYRGMNLTPFIGNMMNQIRTESSGDPNAINTTDINAQRGDPSIGLLQVIGSTFRNALRGTPFEYLIAAGQRNPRASLTASTLYSLNRYGSLDRAWRGVAYENGGVLPPGFTMAYNGTGQNEFTFTRDQMVTDVSQAVVNALRGMVGTTITGGQHGGVQIGQIVNNSGSDLNAALALAAARL